MERPRTCASGRRLNDRICETTPVGAVTNGSVMGGAELRGGHAERRCAKAVDAAALVARILHCEAVRWVELGFRVRRTDMLFRPVPGDSRKRRGNVSGIRRAPPRATLSSEAVRVGPSKDRARARHPTPTRDCACVRSCDRPTQSQRLLSDAKVILPKRHPSSNPQHHRAPISRSVTPSSAVGKGIHARLSRQRQRRAAYCRP